MTEIYNRRVVVKVPATSANLGPGYDTLGMAVNLFLTAKAKIIKGRGKLSLSGEGRDILPNDESNLLYQSYLQYGNHTGLALPSLEISVINAIPLKRGLGSSSAAIAAGILIADSITGKNLPQKELVCLASAIEGHPDNVTPCLTGGISVCCNDGDTVHFRSIVPPDWLRLVAVIPDMVVETKKARAVLPENIPIKDAIFSLQRAALQIAVWHSTEPAAESLMFDDLLHQKYRKKLIPGFDEVLNEAKNAGATGVYLSGSGPTIIALYNRGGKKIGEKMISAFQKYGIHSRMKLLKPVSGNPEIKIN